MCYVINIRTNSKLYFSLNMTRYLWILYLYKMRGHCEYASMLSVSVSLASVRLFWWARAFFPDNRLSAGQRGNTGDVRQSADGDDCVQCTREEWDCLFVCQNKCHHSTDKIKMIKFIKCCMIAKCIPNKKSNWYMMICLAKSSVYKQ